MRELYVEELESVTGGQPALDPQIHTTMACCEEGPLSGCCWYWEPIRDLLSFEIEP